MRNLLRTAWLAVLCLFVSIAFAQDQERGPMWEITTMKVAPAHAQAFQENIASVVKAAGMADLSADYGWNVWSDDFEFSITNRVTNMAQFDDEEAWMREFKDTEGEALLQQAFQKFEEMDVHSVSREVWEGVPSWTYEREDAPPTAGGTMFTFSIKEGAYEAFDKLVPEFVAAWKKMDYPYNVRGYRTFMGDTGKVNFLVTYDAPSAFYGENDFMAVAERTGHSELYTGLRARLTEVIDNMQTDMVTYHSNLSYWGPTTASN